MATCNGREVLTITQACKAVGVCRRTVYNWIKKNKVECVRTPSGVTRIFVDTLWRSAENEVRRGG